MQIVMEAWLWRIHATHAMSFLLRAVIKWKALRQFRRCDNWPRSKITDNRRGKEGDICCAIKVNLKPLSWTQYTSFSWNFLFTAAWAMSTRRKSLTKRRRLFFSCSVAIINKCKSGWQRLQIHLKLKISAKFNKKINKKKKKPEINKVCAHTAYTEYVTYV